MAPSSQRPLWVPLPDPQVVLTPETQQLYRLAGWVGHHSGDDHYISFTSVLIAFLLAEDRVSRWLRTYIHPDTQSRLLAYRGATPEQLRAQVVRSAAEEPAPTWGREGWTSSAVRLFRAAAELAGKAPLAPEHLLAAYLLHTPPGHEEDYRRWGLDKEDWTAAFKAQSFLGESPPQHSPGTLFGERPLSPALADVLRLASGLRARRSSGQPWLTSSDLLFAVLEHGREWNDSGGFLFRAVLGSVAGNTAYERLRAEHYGDVSRLRDSPPQPAPVTPNAAMLAALAQELHGEVTGTGPLALRHLVAALLLHEASGGSGLERRFQEFGLDRRLLRERFFQEVCVPPAWDGTPQDDVGRWRARMWPGSDEPAGLRPWISVDVPGGVDRLDFQRHASAFASLIASREVATPLAIGVFGEWGSGKTFFMRHVEHHVRERQQDALRQPGQTSYLSEIAHIHFNAWQYVESNLWASLAEHVFRSLAESFRERSLEAELDLRELATARVMQQQVEAEHRQARKALRKAERELADARAAHEAAASKVATTLWGQLQLSALGQETCEALRELFGEEALTTASNLKASYEDLRAASGRAQRLWVYALKQGPPSLRLVLLSMAALVGLVAVLALLPGPERIRATLMALSAVLTPVYGLIAWLTPRLKKGTELLRKVEEGAHAASGEIRNAEDRVAKARSQLEAARVAIGAATTRAEEARQRASAAEVAVSTPQTAERISRFIEERITSEDYRQKLGLLHLVRRDFERLSKLLTEHREVPREQRATGRPGLERIVLYIDDLDRCPRERVVQVLEAVHLLLAFDLFVVLVAVDARWVHSALSRRFPFLRRGKGSSPHASVHDYLEKIFQLPFWLPAMDDTGCRALIAELLPHRPLTATPGPTPPPAQAAPTPPPPPDSRGRQERPPAVPPPAPPSAPTEAPPARSDALEIEPLEVQYMQGLVDYFPSSPRRVKRLLNTYRLLKATTTREEYTHFVHGEHGSGPYQAVITLLTLVIGAPRLFQAVLKRLETEPKALMAALLRELDTTTGFEPDEQRRVLGALEHYRRIRRHSTTDELARWAPRVARYSFLTLAPAMSPARDNPGGTAQGSPGSPPPNQESSPAIPPGQVPSHA